MKKTPSTFDFKMERKYNFSLCFITDYIMHCRFMDQVEEDKSMEIIDEPKVFKNKREFKEYVAECREFDRLYMNPSDTMEVLKKAAIERHEKKENLETKIHSNEKKSKSVNKLLADFLMFHMGVNYIKGIMLRMCLVKSRCSFTSWIIKERCLIPYLSTFLVRLMIT